MNVCPFHQSKPREGLPELPSRIAALPLDDRGYPVPFFVAEVDGKPDFRVMDGEKWRRCHNERLCWVCGEKLGSYVSFVVGPMCSINRTTAEPPSHRECATWSAQACPFLTKPKMVRRDGEIIQANRGNVAGEMIERNPGVTCIWTVKTTGAKPHGYIIFRDHQNKPLIEMGIPSEVRWWREGRPATRQEVLESIESGLPALEAACESEPLAHQRDEAHVELANKTLVAMQYLPAVEEKRLIVTV